MVYNGPKWRNELVDSAPGHNRMSQYVQLGHISDKESRHVVLPLH